MQRLSDKVAIVTGAGQGIGAAIARRFAEEGAQVAIAERNPETGARMAAEISGDTGATAISVVTDVADRTSVEAMVAEVTDRLGDPDVLVNNAGVAVFGDPLSITDEDWARCMSVDLDGAWHCARAVLPAMRARKNGAIINIASNHALQVIRDTFPYPVAKHGVIGLTRALALQYAGEGIAVNAISPGYIDTPIAEWYFKQQPDAAAFRRETEAKQPVGRLGRPEEVAAVAALLASDEARFMTGANLVIDGGVTIRMYE
ncbi:SDR family oxidoreductase [Bauldia sp.]|uniref:SDR family oxidoreductase n=1 Tax=Bauldia sp. TaxID=2575872 RepID=UPI003BAB5701